MIVGVLEVDVVMTYNNNVHNTHILEGFYGYQPKFVDF
jgi:hypothetical protein